MTTICPLDEHCICDYKDHPSDSVYYACNECPRYNDEGRIEKQELKSIRSAAGCLFVLCCMIVVFLFVVKIIVVALR